MRVGVIGVGRMGRNHLRAAQELDLNVVGIADADAATLADAGDACGVPAARRFTSAAALLEQGPELVLIATTAPPHADLTCEALAAGATHVLCEKPMATSLAACDRMIDEADARGAALAINHQMRFMPRYAVPRELLHGDELGGPTSVNVVAGNFGMATCGTHYLEMFRLIAGAPVEEVRARFDPDPVASPRGPQFQDRAGVLRARATNGVRLHLDASADQGHGLLVSYAARHGWVCVDELAGELTMSARLPEHRDAPTSRYGMPHRRETRDVGSPDTLAPTRAVIAALLARDDYPTGRDGRAAVEALVAAHVSDREDRAVRLDEPLPRDEAFPWA